MLMRTCADGIRLRGAVAADVIGLFETALKETKPDSRSVTYALQDLNEFVDTHVELCALVYVSGGADPEKRG